MIRKTVARLNQRAASMLPVTTKELITLDLYDAPISLAAMRNKTTEWLRRMGQCLDDVVLTEIEDSVKLVAKRQFNFGDVVLPVPLFATIAEKSCYRENGSEECDVWQSSYRHCLSHDDSTVVLCPLSLAVFAGRSDDANVIFRWSSWNAKNNQGRKSHPDEVIRVSLFR